MSSSLPAARVDFPKAIVEVLAALKEVPSISISGLARTTGIDRRTVSKAIDLIMNVQDSLATRKIDRRKEGKMWVVSMGPECFQLHRFLSLSVPCGKWNGAPGTGSTWRK